MSDEKKPLGLWWLYILGGGAIVYFLATRSSTSKPSSSISVPDPYGGQAAPTQAFHQAAIDAATFSKVCTDNKGMMISGSCVGVESGDLGPGKHVLKLMPNGQIFNMTTNQWLYDA